MKNPSETPKLNQVLFNFLIENENPTRDVLTEWINRFPEYEKELVDLAVDWFQMTLPLPDSTEIEDETMVVQRGVDFIHNYLLEEEVRLQVTPKAYRPFRGFIAEARRLNIPVNEFAARIGITPALLAKVDQRLIKYSSIPIELLQSIVELIDTDISAAAKYLQLQPMIPQNQRFKSTQPPQVSAQVNFFDEIREESDLSEDQRQHWLSFESKRE